MLPLKQNTDSNRTYTPLEWNRFRYKITVNGGSIEFFYGPSMEEVMKMYSRHYPGRKAKFEQTLK